MKSQHFPLRKRSDVCPQTALFEMETFIGLFNVKCRLCLDNQMKFIWTASPFCGLGAWPFVYWGIVVSRHLKTDLSHSLCNKLGRLHSHYATLVSFPAFCPFLLLGGVLLEKRSRLVKKCLLKATQPFIVANIRPAKGNNTDLQAISFKCLRLKNVSLHSQTLLNHSKQSVFTSISDPPRACLGEVS